MRFNSAIYWLFLGVVVTLLWAIPQRAKRWWLLGASLIFYASWHPPYLALLVGVAAVAHFGAVWIVGGPDDRSRRGGIVIAGLLGLLGLFKYLDWMTANVNGLVSAVGVSLELPLPKWVLPLGISFYVFQAVSYVVDIVRKREKIHGFFEIQLYIAYFPQLIAGPIMRAKEFLPQVSGTLSVKARDIHEGLWLLSTGLFTKLVLADGLASRVDDAFSRSPDSLGATDVVIMATAFGIQIYLDFSSYTRMAIGSARLCGLRLVENFNHPYSARSPVDFWNRWHISLSRWIRDYLFYPLTGRKTNLGALVKAALLSMTLCGLWHGAGWTFVVWGLYHGALIAGYHALTYRSRGKPRKARSLAMDLAAIGMTFGLVTLGWIFFRATSLAQATELIANVLTPWAHTKRALAGTFYLHTSVLTAGVWLAPLVRSWMKRQAPSTDSAWRPRALALAQGIAVGCLIAASLVYLQGQSSFIYFQF